MKPPAADAAAPPLSVVMPVLDEAAGIQATLQALAPLRAWGAELIVVDGGSRDDTPARAAENADRVLTAARGRARQMNAGVALARSPRLLFLHADTLLPEGAGPAVVEALDSGPAWGRFDVRITGRSRWLPLVATMINLRSRASGIATGDQALFMTRQAFDAVGGFPDQPLMEDVEISKHLKRLSPPACLRPRVTTSGRRWDQRGAWRTIVLMWQLRWAYWRGVPADVLATRYR